MRPARRPGLLPAKAAFSRFRGDFWAKNRIFGDFWKSPLPRELNPRLPLFREGRDRLYQAPTFHFLRGGCATGQKLRRDLGKISEMCQSVAYLHITFPLHDPLFSTTPGRGAGGSAALRDLDFGVGILVPESDFCSGSGK